MDDSVELYVVGERAIAMLHNWQGYGSRPDVNAPRVRGDRVMSFVITQSTVNGWIRTGRLTQGDGQAALYVTASDPNVAAPMIV